MCKHGTTIDLEVTIRKTEIGSEKSIRPIDKCIATIVEALERNDVHMEGSCCGHGKNPGQIILADGRVLTIIKNLELSNIIVDSIMDNPLTRASNVIFDEFSKLTDKQLNELSKTDYIRNAIRIYKNNRPS